MEKFVIPIVLFIFKRYETTLRIIDRIREVNAAKIYLIGDGPRNEEEAERVRICREKVEMSLDWGCEIVRNYATKNRGVYENIGKGAAWVFQQENKAIFLEDDNLPEKTFFRYCAELLTRYEYSDNVLWISGTNYLTEYFPPDGSSYIYTQHLLPCGWASWSEKFLKYYDGGLHTLDQKDSLINFRKSYKNPILYKQQLHSIRTTKRKLELELPVSWDFQMCFSVRANNMYGISPCRNQIENIGADADSTHGGTTLKKTMTNRFCSMKTIPLSFPLKHPVKIAIDCLYETKISKLITWPLKTQTAFRLCYLVKPILGMDKYDSMSLKMKTRKK